MWRWIAPVYRRLYRVILRVADQVFSTSLQVFKKKSINVEDTVGFKQIYSQMVLVVVSTWVALDLFLPACSLSLSVNIDPSSNRTCFVGRFMQRYRSLPALLLPPRSACLSGRLTIGSSPCPMLSETHVSVPDLSFS